MRNFYTEVLTFLKHKNLQGAFSLVMLLSASIGYGAIPENASDLNENLESIQITVTGNVTDELGEPLPGVNVIEFANMVLYKSDFKLVLYVIIQESVFSL